MTHSLARPWNRSFHGRKIRTRILAVVVAGCLFSWVRDASGAESRPLLEGGVKQSEPYRPNVPPGRPAPREAICERYAAAVAQQSGRIQVMPKAGGGGPLPQGRPIAEYCLAPNPNWTLLGEDRNSCCFFAPNEWVAKIPPLPGNVQENKEPPNRRPTKDDPKRDPTYDGKTRRDGPLPWEQPAEAQTSRSLGIVSVTVRWDANIQENGQRKQRKGECSFQFEFYTDGAALARNFTYHNEDRTRPFPDRIDVEAIHGSVRTAPFRSNVRLIPKQGGLYDISWTNPALTASQSRWSEYPEDRGVRRAPQDGGAPSQLYEAYCIGRSIGSVGNRPALEVRLVDVSLRGGYLPRRANTFMLRDLQKQVPEATVSMNWQFQPPNTR
jgi:hypothetical protein